MNTNIYKTRDTAPNNPQIYSFFRLIDLHTYSFKANILLALLIHGSRLKSTNPIPMRKFSQPRYKSSGRSGGRGRIERFLLGTGEDFVRACLLSADSQQVKVIQEMRDDAVHAINVTLAANLISVEDVHGGAEARVSLRQGVVLGGLPVADKNIVSRGL